MKPQKMIALTIALFIALSIPLSAISGVFAAPVGTISLTTPTPGVALGGTFTVTANIAGASNVWQWVITNLAWNPAVLEYVSDAEGNFLKAGGATFYAAAPANQAGGTLPEVSSTRLALTTASGNGDLVTFTFKVVGFGDSTISVGSAKLADSAQVETPITIASVTYDGLPPPAPYGPTAVITSPGNNIFVVTGTEITLNGANSLPGFNGMAAVPITAWGWTVDRPAPLDDLTFSGATPGTFGTPNAGDYTVTLTVTATGATPETDVETAVIHVVAPPSGPAVDVYTQKGGKLANVGSDAFGPQERVILYANVTYNNVPVVGKEVAFEIRDASDNLIAVRTGISNSEGLATAEYRLPWPDVNPEGTFGTWSIVATVDISQVVVDDTVSFTFNYLLKTTAVATLTNTNMPASSFSRDGPTMKVNVTVRNIANTPMTGKVCVTIYDEAHVPVAVAEVDLTVPAGISAATAQTIDLPHYSFVGQATAYVNILTQLPSLGGVPYCPEASQGFTITA